ncbi:type II secretion system F family protein [Candidatus Uhrbacteria bacterium]|nr:type II secretion system F family protein [Candidatus Uhrbacteria bacterium]
MKIFTPRVPFKEKMFFVEHLSVMLKAAIPLDRALSSLAEQTEHKGFKTILAVLLENVKKGEALSKGLEEFPKVFGQLFINMIRAGELGGKLEGALRRLYVQMKKDYDLRSRVKSALTYPAFVLVAMAGIGTVIMVFVIPKLIPLFEGFNAQLPLPTRLLIALSHFISNSAIILAISAALSLWLLIYLARGPLKRQFDRLLTRLPILGGLIKKVNLARFARTFSTMLSTDILVVDALKITADVLGNDQYRLATIAAAEKIGQGVAVAAAFKETKNLFPPTMITMLQIGEESGTLTDLLEEVAGFYEESVDEMTKNLSSIIEPLLILILGAGVGGIAVAILLPMYSLLEQI